ncbi:MAG TPA: hypothetical protein VGA73_10310 [Candidatus Binatia bacterium]
MERGRSKVSIGARVKIKAHHWLRALEEGTVVEYQPHARNCWLVQFEHQYPGGGIDGDKLYFDEAAFLEVSSRSATHVEAPANGAHKFSAAPAVLDIN